MGVPVFGVYIRVPGFLEIRKSSVRLWEDDDPVARGLLPRAMERLLHGCAGSPGG